MTSSLTEIDWETQSSEQVYNLFRSLYSYKELTTKFKNVVVKILELRLGEREGAANQLPGTVEYVKSKKVLSVYCSDGRVVEVLKLKVDGKKVMSAVDFNNGFLNKCSQKEKMFGKFRELKNCL